MLCGRGFSEAYGNERNKVVLNEEAVRLLGYPSPEEALGKQLEMEVLEDPLEVVGVVKNYHQQSLAEPYKPILFFLKERVPFIATPYISVKMDGSVNSDRLAEVEQMYRTYFPSTKHFRRIKRQIIIIDSKHLYQLHFGWIAAVRTIGKVVRHLNARHSTGNRDTDNIRYLSQPFLETLHFDGHIIGKSRRLLPLLRTGYWW